MVRERIAVINVSLVGPDNAVLARIVALLTARGYAIVAAVGNDGRPRRPCIPLLIRTSSASPGWMRSIASCWKRLEAHK